jgi:hypothetical protein
VVAKRHQPRANGERELVEGQAVVAYGLVEVDGAVALEQIVPQAAAGGCIPGESPDGAPAFIYR